MTPNNDTHWFASISNTPLACVAFRKLKLVGKRLLSNASELDQNVAHLAKGILAAAARGSCW